MSNTWDKRKQGKDVMVSLRISAHLKALLDLAAGKKGVPVAEFIREAVIKEILR